MVCTGNEIRYLISWRPVLGSTLQYGIRSWVLCSIYSGVVIVLIEALTPPRWLLFVLLCSVLDMVVEDLMVMLVLMMKRTLMLLAV